MCASPERIFFQIAKSFCVSFIECSDFLISVIKIVIFYFSDFLLLTENLQHLHHKFSKKLHDKKANKLISFEAQNLNKSKK